jgi:hypothetical protein
MEAAARRHLGYRLRTALKERRASVVAVGVLLAVLTVLAGAAAAQVATPRYRALAGEAAARFGAAQGQAATAGASRASGAARSGGGASSPAPPPAHSTATAMLGSFWTSEGTHNPQFAPVNLVRGGDMGTAGWRSRSEALPQEVGFELREPVTLDRLAFRQTPAAPPESWAREVEVLLSASDRDSGLVSAGRWILARTTAPQEFSFRPTLARFVRLRLLARHGEAPFISLGAFAIGAQGRDQQALLAP